MSQYLSHLQMNGIWVGNAGFSKLFMSELKIQIPRCASLRLVEFHLSQKTNIIDLKNRMILLKIPATVIFPIDGISDKSGFHGIFMEIGCFLPNYRCTPQLNGMVVMLPKLIILNIGFGPGRFFKFSQQPFLPALLSILPDCIDNFFGGIFLKSRNSPEGSSFLDRKTKCTWFGIIQ